MEVLATAGNNHLGGDDFDQCIVGYLLEQFRKYIITSVEIEAGDFPGLQGYFVGKGEEA